MDRPLSSLALRQAIVQRLRADPDLIALVPADRIYGQRTPSPPTWPFVRTGAPNEVPIRAGTEVRLSMHAFSKQKFDDEAAMIAAVIQKSLEYAVLQLDGGLKAHITFLASQILQDGAEADAWHAVLSFNATIG